MFPIVPEVRYVLTARFWWGSSRKARHAHDVVVCHEEFLSRQVSGKGWVGVSWGPSPMLAVWEGFGPDAVCVRVVRFVW